MVKKFPPFHATHRLTAALAIASHLSPPHDTTIHSRPSHSKSYSSILILFSHTNLGPPSGHFLSGLPTKTTYASHLSPIRAICPTHLFILDIITRIIFGEEYRVWSSSLCSLLDSPVRNTNTSQLMGKGPLRPQKSRIIIIIIIIFIYCIWVVTRWQWLFYM